VVVRITPVVILRHVSSARHRSAKRSSQRHALCLSKPRNRLLILTALMTTSRFDRLS
jgi:hypothetical protein